jgi:hypothetical protein
MKEEEKSNKQAVKILGKDMMGDFMFEGLVDND